MIANPSSCHRPFPGSARRYCEAQSLSARQFGSAERLSTGVASSVEAITTCQSERLDATIKYQTATTSPSARDPHVYVGTNLLPDLCVNDNTTNVAWFSAAVIVLAFRVMADPR